MGTMNMKEALTQMFSPDNQRILVELLKKNMIGILKRAEEIKIIELKQDEIEKIKQLRELGDMRLHYKKNPPSDQGKSWDYINKEFLTFAKGHSRSSDITAEEAQMFSDCIHVSYHAAYSLRFFRNCFGHLSTKIEDPAPALALAGVVLHLIEVELPPKRIETDNLRKAAMELFKQCHTFFEEEKRYDEAERQKTKKEEKSAADATTSKMLPVSKEQEIQSSDIVLKKLEALWSEWRKDIENLLQPSIEDNSRLLASNVAELVIKKLQRLAKEKINLTFDANWLRSLMSDVAEQVVKKAREDISPAADIVQPEKLPNPKLKKDKSAALIIKKIEQSESKWRKAIENVIDRIPDVDQLAVDLATEIVKRLPKESHLVRSPQANELGTFDGPVAEDEIEYPEAGPRVSPSLTPPQALTRLIALRNRINGEFIWEGEPIPAYLNVLQRPIIQQMIQEKICTIEQWKEAGGKINARYIDPRNPQEAMDKQLEDYGEEIFEIMNSIADDVPF